MTSPADALGARPVLGSVGILALEVYFPRLAVAQSELEQADGVPGKYTAGLGQLEMAVPSEREDVVSMALSACARLMERHGVQPASVGRLEVGSECGPDRSKSIKSYLVQLFRDRGNTSLAGVDCVHGCYGATAALLNAAAWVESSFWDGRLAVVVASDVALYAPGSAARATGGCGAVAMLVGPDAPLALDAAWHVVFSDHTFDFQKPNGGSSPYPEVDGPCSIDTYMAALDSCAHQLRAKLQRAAQAPAPAADAASGFCGRGGPEPQHAGASAAERQQGLQQPQQQGRPAAETACSSALLLPQVDHFVAHAPFHRLVRKALARLLLGDALLGSRQQAEQLLPGLNMDVAAGAAGHGRQLEQQALQASAAQFAQVASDGCWLQQRLGNLYCGSLYSGLAALLERQGAQLEGRRVLLFSYGSGAMAAMLCLVGRRPSGGGPGTRPAADVSLAALQLRSDLAERLAQRKLVDVRRYNQLADRAAGLMQGLAPAAVQGGAGAGAGAGAETEEHWPGAWQLQLVDEQHRRWYAAEGEV